MSYKYKINIDIHFNKYKLIMIDGLKPKAEMRYTFLVHMIRRDECLSTLILVIFFFDIEIK